MTYPAQGPAQTAPAPALPQLEDPGAIGGVRPRIADLRNRCVIVQPLSIARGVPGVQAGQVQDRITANIFVLDGGPLEFGGKPEKYVPHTLVVPTPFLAEGVYISQVNMVSALLSSLPSPQKPQGGLVVGVIAQGITTKQGNNPPWNLVTLDEHDPRRQFAAQLLQAFFTGAFRNPEPMQTGAPTPPGGALAYTHAVTMPHNAQGQPIPNAAEIFPQGHPANVPASVTQLQDQTAQAYNAAMVQQQMQQGAMQQYPTPGTAGGAPQYVPAAPPIDPGYAAYLAQQQAAAVPQSAPPANIAPTGPGGMYMPQNTAAAAPTPSQAAAADPAPMGWSQDVWNTLTAEQRAGIRASHAPAAASAAPAQPPF